MNKKIMLTGGTGLLGTELQKLRKFDCAPSRDEFNICDGFSFDFWEHYLLADPPGYPDLLVHAAAFTAVERAEVDKQECFDVNVVGTLNLVALGVPILYISTSYVFDGEKGNYSEWEAVNPLGYYATTKALAEQSVLGAGNVVLRTLFKPSPWPHHRAYTDQISNGDYVGVIAKKINQAIDHFDGLPPIIHVGTETRTIFELAQQTRKDVGQMSRKEVAANLPCDISLDCSLWNQIIGEE